MKKSRITNSQIMANLKQNEAPDLCQEHGISGAIFYKQRPKLDRMDASMISRIKELKAEKVDLYCALIHQTSSVETAIINHVCGHKMIISDNWPEYISHELRNWLEKQQIKHQFIEPGKPQQNAYIERYNRAMRYDWLNQHLFNSIEEVQDYAAKQFWLYNHERPNIANDGLPPCYKIALNSSTLDLS